MGQVGIAAAVVLLAAAAARPVLAQVPSSRADSATGTSSYTSLAFEAQLTVENLVQRARVGAVVGRLWPVGDHRGWRPQVAAALTAIPGKTFLDGITLGPRLTVTRALPLASIFGPGQKRLLLGVSGLLDGTWRFAGFRDRRGTSFEPALRGSLGYRFLPESTSTYTFLRLEVEGRRHVRGPTLYVGLGFERPRTRARPADGH